MRRDRKIRRYRRRIRFVNAGSIVFFAVFIYVIAALFSYLGKDKDTIFRVTSDTANDVLKTKGICIRTEEVVKASASGYVNYYIGNLARASKQEPICSIDSTGTIYSKLESKNDNSDVFNADVISILRQYHVANDGNFNRIYSLKENIVNQLLIDSGNNIVTNLKSVIEDYGGSNYFHVDYATESGIVVHNLDGFEGTKVNDVTAEMFDENSTGGAIKAGITEDVKNVSDKKTKGNDLSEKNSISSEKITSNLSAESGKNSPAALSGGENTVEAGAPLYKLIYDEEWHIVIPLSSEYYEKVSGLNSANVKINNSTYSVKAYISTFDKGKDHFADLKLYNYMVNYADVRFVDVSIMLDSVTGLKIPKSSVVEKEFYVVPLSLFTSEEASQNGLYRLAYDKKGDTKKEFIESDIYYTYDPLNPPPESDKESVADDNKISEKVALISADGKISAGDKLVSPDGGASFTVNKMASMKGVWIVNRGYPQFRRVKILDSIDDYYLVYPDSNKGVSEYDNIIINGKNGNKTAM